MRLYKTELGQSAFKERSPLFSARQRSTFILFDGKKTVAEVLAATAGMGMSQFDIDHLLAMGFLAQQPGDVAAVTGSMPLQAESMPATLAAADPPAAPRSEQQRYFDAKPVATQLTASLGLRGFMLNLAVESAAGYAELLKLLPKIQDAVGAKASRKLERALLD
ncbi:hypothetical protein DIC66_14375 [Rhodoferax lacus]|uniref:Uncharacterized protein n=1 Tax=Rhodoferax lacus TaxID=2184758 RepID=A0A3E1R9Z1_9BURK|nr:hypothetical protein [Rhodoferax lacus]RFO96186.1 hypothetical protein DIC66_14375 [Rhodoferax lacus]